MMNIPGPGQKPGPSPFQNRFKNDANSRKGFNVPQWPGRQQQDQIQWKVPPSSELPYQSYEDDSSSSNNNSNRVYGIAPQFTDAAQASSQMLAENANYLRKQSDLFQLQTLQRIQRQREEMSRKSREATERAEAMIQRSREAALKAAKKRSERHFLETTRFISTPFFAFALSFWLYPSTAKLFRETVQHLSGNLWVPVDGGELQWSVLLPALNGVVMTAVSLLYANLINTTGSQLRERQIKIQESLRTEVMGIRGLAQLLPYYPDNFRPIFGTQLMAYIQELVIELGAGRGGDNDDGDSSINIKRGGDLDLRSFVPSLSDYRNELHRASMTSMTEEETLNANIRERSYEMLDRVATGRMSRVTALQTVFPPLHYFTITALSATILLVFLLETDRPVIQYLDSFQLRLIWGLLVGTITAIYCIGIDLNYPFVGTYTVPADRLLDESDELMRLIKGTFPGQSEVVAEMLSGRRGEIVQEDRQHSLSPTAESMPMMTSSQSEIDFYASSSSQSDTEYYYATDLPPQTEESPSFYDSSSPYSDLGQQQEEATRRWIEGRGYNDYTNN